MKKVNLQEIADQLKTKGRYWIVFTGDSITDCEWIHPNWREMVIYVLHEELTKFLNGDWKSSVWGIKGFNFAYDGATTRDILDKIDDVLLVDPDLVIGLMGGNDPVFGISVEDSVENISKVADRVLDLGSKLVWCNSTPAGKGCKKNLKYKPYAKAFINMEERNNFMKLDMFNIYQEFSTERFFTFVSEEIPEEGIKAGEIDKQHPNQLGNAYIAKVVLENVFNIKFDPEKYIRETLEGIKYPGY